MSETNITRRPLWKQLTGALAGAAIAFVLYQGYSVAADRLVATIPMGPAAGSSDSSSSQSSENRVFYGPFGSIRSLKRYFQPLPSGSSSSTAESVTTAAGAAPLIGTQVTGLSSSSLSYVTVTARSSSTSSRRSAQQISGATAFSNAGGGAASSSSWSEAFPVAAPPIVTHSVPAGTGTSTDALQEPFVRLTPPAIVVGAEDVTRSALPKTGLGLDVLAVMALGAMAGGRWKWKR